MGVLISDEKPVPTNIYNFKKPTFSDALLKYPAYKNINPKRRAFANSMCRSCRVTQKLTTRFSVHFAASESA
jgi:hypothetical protein